MKDFHSFVDELLVNNDHRYTVGRRRLVDVLMRSKQPLTLPEIVDVAPDLAASSVYRNLEVLERSGVVHRINSGGQRAHFELAEPLVSHHHHLVCTGCGAIADVQLDDQLEELLDQTLTGIAHRFGFKPRSHNLDIHGHCTDCNNE